MGDRPLPYVRVHSRIAAAIAQAEVRGEQPVHPAGIPRTWWQRALSPAHQLFHPTT
jgi:hypothetical protein